MKTFKFLLLAVAAIVCLSACSKSKDDSPASSVHKAKFRVEVSAGASIIGMTYGYDDQFKTQSTPSGTVWESAEVTIPAGARTVWMETSGQSPNASGTMKAQIYIDGVLKKEVTSSGIALVGSPRYNF